jgi:hypothetical protein
MSLNAAQFEALFTNAFGDGTTAHGVQIDATGETAIGRAGPHTVELLVVQGRAIEWRIDGATLAPWKQHAKDDPTRQANGEALRAKLV